MSETVSVEALKEHFPPQILEPYGPVLIIPNRMFKRGWELELEAQGHRVFATSYNGESSFLVRLDKGESRSIEKAPTPSVNSPNANQANSSKDKAEWKRWTLQDTQTLKKMFEQNVDVAEIAKALGRTVNSVERKIQRSGLKLPEGGPRATVSGDSNPTITEEDHVVKELLAAASELYPRYRHACRFLLLETTKMLGGE